MVELTLGSVTLPVEMNVCENLIEPWVLGCDFIRQHKYLVEAGEGYI